jgi:hypothetical protein
MAQEWQVPTHTSVSQANSTVMVKPTSTSRRAPSRSGFHEEARESLALLRGCNQSINVVLVGLTDGVELEVWADGTLRSRSRFLRDTQARKYSARLTARLQRRGYRPESERG